MAHKVPVYSIILRLGGHDDPVTLHEVPLSGVTQKEIVLLKSKHGAASVRDAKETGTRDFADEAAELFHLARKYSSNAQDMAEQGAAVMQVGRLFNADMSGYENWLIDEIDLEESIREESNQKRQAEQRQVNIAQKKAELQVLEKV